MKLKCIAIDDEPLALKVIDGYVKKIPFLELLGLYENAFESLELIKSNTIDLLFLDINMPDLSGVEFLKSLTHPPHVIMTTAYQQYALEGYELDVVDYLLKPFAFDRFLKAVNKVYKLRKSNLPGETQLPVSAISEATDYIFIKSEHNIIKINLKDIFYIEGYKDYIKIYTHDAKPLLTIKSIKATEEMLEGKGFLRMHKSFIISLDKIQSFRNGKVHVRDTYIPIGESYKDIFFEKVVKDRI